MTPPPSRPPRQSKRIYAPGQPAASRVDEPLAGPLPGWFWLLPVLALAAWWPIGSFWASDDFFAVHYAQDLSRALADLAGPQYGAADHFLFYRPLVTLSLWLETTVSGGAPWVSHASNALVLSLAALLGGLLWRRVLDDHTAFCAGLLWAIAGSHVGAACWAVGRTDLQSTLWILLSVLLFVRWTEGRSRTRVLSLLAMVLGLMTKETAMALPGLIALVAFAAADGGPGRRTARALAHMWPYVLVLAGYLIFRLLALGAFGGYMGASADPLAMAAGLGTIVLDLINPLRWSQPTFLGGYLGEQIVRDVLPWLGYLPVAWAAIYLLMRPHRARTTLWILLLCLCAAVPYAPFWTGADNHHNLRYYGLALVALTGLLAAPGVWCAALAVVLFAPATVQLRLDQHAADRATAAMHQRLLQQHAQGLPGPWFVHGLPHIDPTGTALQFHFGVDRLLEPPFGPGGTLVYAHRPIAEVPGAIQLLDESALPIAPPIGTTMTFEGPGLLVTVPETPLPDLDLQVEGSTQLDNDALRRMVDDEVRIVLRTTSRAPVFRITWFTPTGYMSTMAPATPTPDGTELTLDRAFFRQAQWATGGESYVLKGIGLAAVLDFAPEYPMLLEAGNLSDLSFTPTHRARIMPMFRFDRTMGSLFR